MFKPSQLHITFYLNDGTQKQYRLIASMARSDFLLSPLIENTNDFSLLYAKSQILNDKAVMSFIIDETAQNGHWNKAYTINFKDSTVC